MKLIISIACTAVICITVHAQQKPIIDTGMLGTWPYLNGDATLSKDGRYAAYTIRNLPVNANTFFVQDISGNWKKRISAKMGSEFYFSDDSKTMVLHNGDSLLLQSTGEDQCS